MPYNATFCHIWSENITFHPASPTKTPPQGSDLKFSISLTGSSRVGRCKHCYTDPLLLKGTYLVFIVGQCADCYQLLLLLSLVPPRAPWYFPLFFDRQSIKARCTLSAPSNPSLMIGGRGMEVDWDKNTH